MCLFGGDRTQNWLSKLTQAEDDNNLARTASLGPSCPLFTKCIRRYPSSLCRAHYPPQFIDRHAASTQQPAVDVDLLLKCTCVGHLARLIPHAFATERFSILNKTLQHPPPSETATSVPISLFTSIHHSNFRPHQSILYLSLLTTRKICTKSYTFPPHTPPHSLSAGAGSCSAQSGPAHSPPAAPPRPHHRPSHCPPTTGQPPPPQTLRGGPAPPRASCPAAPPGAPRGGRRHPPPLLPLPPPL